MTVYRDFPADGHSFCPRCQKWKGGDALKRTLDEIRAEFETLDKLREELEKSQIKAEQYEHRVQRLENRLSYKENRKRKERAHRLITRGAAIESILPQVKDLSEVSFYELMEQVLTQPETAAEIERNLKGGG